MPQICFKIPQAYLYLEIPFFLHLDPAGEQALKQHLVRQTRRHHPDLLPPEASDSERESCEATLAALNAAHLRLRDLPSRLDLVLDAIASEHPVLKEAEKPQLPKALAMEYFELQEALEETPNNPATQAALHEFHRSLAGETLALSREIEKLISAWPLRTEIASPSESLSVSMPLETLTPLITLRNRQRYLLRLQNDLETKQGVVSQS